MDRTTKISTYKAHNFLLSPTNVISNLIREGLYITMPQQELNVSGISI